MRHTQDSFARVSVSNLAELIQRTPAACRARLAATRWAVLVRALGIHRVRFRLSRPLFSPGEALEAAVAALAEPGRLVRANPQLRCDQRGRDQCARLRRRVASHRPRFRGSEAVCKDVRGLDAILGEWRVAGTCK